jgi:ferric-dicitrate binding protein FerR (iron transport regulator)
LRLAAGTAVRLAAAHHLDLERGAIYLDTGAAGGGTPLEVRSPLGTATDIGTRFTVALAEGAGGGLRVRVREGAVAVEGAGRRYVAPAGQEVVLRPDGSVARHDVPPYGEAWRWVVAAAPAFAIEGRSVAELLDWVASETGWSIRFADDAVAAEAEAIVLHGSMGELPADEAPFAVLPGAGLEAELDRGTLLVRRAR